MLRDGRVKSRDCGEGRLAGETLLTAFTTKSSRSCSVAGRRIASHMCVRLHDIQGSGRKKSFTLKLPHLRRGRDWLGNVGFHIRKGELVLADGWLVGRCDRRSSDVIV